MTKDLEKNADMGNLMFYNGKLVSPLWRTAWVFLNKLKIKLPCDLVILLLSIYASPKK
jgi:hypothetical protein